MAAQTRSLWKGAISFGLVNIPIELHSATKESGLDFDWLDKRTMDHVGYKRINKKTGMEIESEHIVKGIEYEKDRYVIISDEEIHGALVKSTQTIELESFVSTHEIPLAYFEQPYYISPGKNAGKPYALLCQTLKRTEKVGIGRIVLHNKQHVAAIIPDGAALVLILLRWQREIRPINDLEFPAPDAAAVSAGEISMAEQLVVALTKPWSPEALTDTFTDKVMALVEEKAKTGQIASVSEKEATPATDGLTGIVDFTELLKKSLLRKPPDEKQA